MSIKLSELPNGIRVVTHAMPHLQTASLGVWVGAGSRHEGKGEQGLSHLLEHMAFKGTARRSARDIAEEIERAGGDLNAATGVEQTSYYAHLLAEDAGLALDIMADILLHSTFDAEEMEREKGVILQEIGSVEDTPDDLVFDLFGAAAYPDQSIGRPILGTPDSVSGFDRGAVEDFLSRQYRPDVMVVGAAGNVDHQQLADDVEQRFGALTAGTAERSERASYRGGEARLKRSLGQTHIVCGWEGVPYDDPDHFALQLFCNAVGGGMSSRLFQDVREKRGLAYSIYSFNWSYLDSGLFGFYAATAPRDVAALMPLALDAVATATQNLSDDEIERARAQTKVALLAALESSSSRSDQIARQLLAFGRVIRLDETIERLNSLSTAEVRAAGARALRSPPTVASVGPVGKVMAPDRVAAHIGAA